MRIVLDTNVVLSALLWRGTPYRLLQSIRSNRQIVLFSSAALLTELAEVLARPMSARRLALIGRATPDVLLEYIDAIELVEPAAVPRVVAADTDDDQVVAAAVAAQADLIVTGDRDLLALGSHGELSIVTPADALRMVATAAS